MSTRRPRTRRPPVSSGRSVHSDPHANSARNRSESNDTEVFIDSKNVDDHIGFERLIFFSDAVFAIAITLLVIDIRIPSNAAADLGGALRDLMPNFLGFGISFLVIAAYWMAHHRSFRHIHRYDGVLIWINTLLLMTIAFLPFSTTLISSYGDQTTAVDFYAVNLLLTSSLFMVIWVYAVASGRLVDVRPSREERIQTGLRLAVPSVVILVSIAIAQKNTSDAEYFWLSIPIFQSLVPALLERFRPEQSTSAGQAIR